MEALLQAIQAIAGNQPTRKAKSQRKTKGRGKGRQKLTEAEKAVFMAKNDAECVATFAAAGYKDVQPRVNVMTYDKWISAGRRVKKGEKALRVGPFNLFHIDATELLPAMTSAPTTETVQ
jgi:hypothetical protein